MAARTKTAPPRKAGHAGGDQFATLRKSGMAFVLGLAVLLVLSPASLVVLLIGLLPTVVACVIDRERGMPLAISVGALNSAGVLFFVLDLWSGTGGFGAAFAIVTNVFDMAVLYGMAAIGWIIYLSMSPFAATYLSVSQDMRLQKRMRHQESLIEEWGESVRPAGQS